MLRKNHLYFSIAFAVMSLLSLSCRREEADYLAGTFAGDGPYPVGYTENSTGNMLFSHIDSTGNVDVCGLVLNDRRKFIAAEFDSLGKVRLLLTDSLAVVIAGYNGNRLKYALIRGDDITLREEVRYKYNTHLTDSTIRTYPDYSSEDLLLHNLFSAEKDCLQEMVQVVAAIGTDPEVSFAGCADWVGYLNADINRYLSDYNRDNKRFETETDENRYLAAYKKLFLGKLEGTTFKDIDIALREDSWTGYCDWWFNRYKEWRNRLNLEEMDTLFGMLDTGLGELKITLSWNFYSDIDIHVIEPCGEHLFFGHPRSAVTDAFLDYDDTQGGMGAKENIFWVRPQKGRYSVSLNYFAGSGGGPCTVGVAYKGKVKFYRLTMTTVRESRPVVSFTLDNTIVL